MTDFLEQKKQEIDARLSELRPLVDEFHRLEAAKAALDGVGSTTTTASASPRRRGPGRPRGSSSKNGGSATGKRGRPKGTGSRSKEALKLVTENPGITIPELAEKMSIKQNYLYRVLPGLESDSLVRKDGRGWHATTAA